MLPNRIEGSLLDASGESLERGDVVDEVDVAHEVLDLVCCGFVDSVLQLHNELAPNGHGTGSEVLVERCQRRGRGCNCCSKGEESVEMHGGGKVW